MGIGYDNLAERRTINPGDQALYCLVGNIASWEWSVHVERADMASLGNFAGSHSAYYAEGPEKEIEKLASALRALGDYLSIECSADACRDMDDWDRHNTERARAVSQIRTATTNLETAGGTCQLNLDNL